MRKYVVVEVKFKFQNFKEELDVKKKERKNGRMKIVSQIKTEMQSFSYFF